MRSSFQCFVCFCLCLRILITICCKARKHFGCNKKLSLQSELQIDGIIFVLIILQSSCYKNHIECLIMNQYSKLHICHFFNCLQFLNIYVFLIYLKSKVREREGGKDRERMFYLLIHSPWAGPGAKHSVQVSYMHGLGPRTVINGFPHALVGSCQISSGQPGLEQALCSGTPES